jgi:hypothetical protein
MRFSLTWLPGVLEQAGLKIATVDGWEERGRDEMGTIRGVICHHTAGPRAGNMPSLGTLIKGRSNLPGPLAQLGLGRDGTYYVISAGRCNHAGAGVWQGFTSGNGNFIGIEAENTGGADDSPWPAIQMDAYRRGVAAILKHVNQSEQFCAGHKEYATPPGRKPDPSFEMDPFRADVAAILNGTAPALVPIPNVEPVAPNANTKPRPTLRRGSSGPMVAVLRAKLRLDAGEIFDARTEAAARAFQRSVVLVPDGIVGPKTWAKLDKTTQLSTASSP